MSAKGGSRELFWISAGGLGLLVIFFTVLYIRGDRDPTAQIAFKAKRMELVSSMRLSLAAASEAQNSAVMSAGEQDSKSFADEARRAAAALESGHTELEKLLKERADSQETELMDRFAQALREFQQVDKQLLDLAVQSSNRKAYGLAFGPAMQLLKEMDEALSRIVADHAESPSENKLQVVRLADEVRIGILRMQVLILPHIAEASDQKMDEFESQLSAEDRKVRENFAALSALLSKSDKSNIETTTLRYTEFQKLKSQIIKLSRQNTDVRAVAIALKEKRKAMLACQDALVALEHAIQAEPITSTIPSGRLP
jgi:succinate dehydrogenase flavin-adding protein (antitoxin of CptAB toxin-antitoxin module)